MGARKIGQGGAGRALFWFSDLLDDIKGGQFARMNTVTAKKSDAKKPRQHNQPKKETWVGSLKGLRINLRIKPGVDLTKPTLPAGYWS